MIKNNDTIWIGKRYGRLEVIGFQHKKEQGRGWDWIVRCDCGKEKVVSPNDVKSGKTRSCGCLHDQACKDRATKFRHNVYKNKRLYGIYNGIKKRCYNKNEPRYSDYGARGISMCDEWLSPHDGFDKFVDWALENGYADGLSIDRIDVDGDYSPTNCRWLTLQQQNRNKRETKWVDYRGEHIQLKVLCDRLKIKYDTVHDRIYKRGWSVERAIEEPSQQENSLRSKCIERGLNYGTIRDRITKLGWSEERALNTPSKGRGANKKTYA